MKIPELRLQNQQIARPRRGALEALVARFGAVQAQEYLFAKWALGLRLGPETMDAEIEQAFEEGRILRTHVMRPTWHFVTPADIHWMLDLTAPRVKMAMASNLRQEALDSRLLTRATAAFERVLGGGHQLTRAELKARLAAARLQPNARQMGMVCMQAEPDGVICSGPRRGKQFTHALLGERAPAGRRLSRDESLGELAARYFATHGPATVRDFVWWSGLKAADARRGLDIIKARAVLQDGLTYWVMQWRCRMLQRRRGPFSRRSRFATRWSSTAT